MRFNARKVKKLVITLNGGVDPKRPNDPPEPRCSKGTFGFGGFEVQDSDWEGLCKGLREIPDIRSESLNPKP